MKRLTLLLLMISIFSGCVSLPPMEARKPVTYRSGLFKRGFYQDGHEVDSGDAVKRVSSLQKTADEIHRANVWGWTGFGVYLTGAVVASAGLGHSDSGTVWTGVGLMLASIPFNLVAQSHWTKATEIYNEHLSPSKSGPKSAADVKTELRLFAAPVRQGGLAGLALSF